MPKFYALIVGVDEYQDEEFRNLDGAVRDARELSKFFHERLCRDGGYDRENVHIVLLENPTSEQVRKEFHEIVRQLDNESVFVFYFAGHGLCLAGMNQPSLLCIDAMGSLRKGGSSAGEISPQFVTVESRNGRGDMLFIFDVCRTDVFVSRGGPRKQKGMKELSRDVTNKRKRPRGTGRRCTLSSCSDGEEASDRGYFLKALVAEWGESLANGQGLAVGHEYVGRVKRRLEENSCWQSPDFEGDSFTLTSDGQVDRLGTRFLCGIKRAVVPAFAGIAIALVVLVAIWGFPKLTTLGRDDDKPEIEVSTVPPPGAPVVDEQSSAPEESPVAESSPVVADESGGQDSATDPSSEVATDEAPPTPPDVPVADESEALLKAGWDAYNNDTDYRTALANADAVLKKEPENPGAQDLSRRAKRGLSLQLVSQGNEELESGNALAALQRAVEAATYELTTESTTLRNAAKNAALSEAKKALEIGEYSEAKRLASAVLDVVKTDGYATIVLNDAQEGLDRRNRVANFLSESRKLLAENKLDEALEKVGEALELDSNNAAAKSLKDEIEKKLEDERFAKLLSDGWTALNNSDFDEAATKATAAKNLRPNDQDVANLQAQISQKRANAEFAKLLQEGRDALKKDDYTLAKSKANAALQKNPGSAEAQELLTSAKQANAKRLASEGETSRKSGKLDEADSKSQAALADDSSCKEAKDLQTRIAADRKTLKNQAQIATLLKDAQTALDKGDNQLAQEKANAVLSKDFATSESKAEAQRILSEASKKSENVWTNSPSRKAGTRQTLKIGNAEYGFCWIPAGEFDMGSPESEKDRDSDERLHHVKLTKGFWMLETETTQALYREVMGSNPSNFKGDNLPVEKVSWDDAMKFCAELTKRLPKGVKASLPTESQWEYACRAGTKTAYWYGNSGDESKMNYGHVFKGNTKAVKSYAPNGWGLYDMHGNVWEWVLDYYGDYPTGTVVDPKGPNSASGRVERGGSWGNDAWGCRSALRGGSDPGDRFNYLGFRFLLSCD